LLRALFPCGSVTGAPKIRAMQVIRALEDSPRGIYCGAIGWFAPDRSACFNVAIRTLTITGDRGELGAGGGLVADSRAADEYAECRLKARYFEAARRPLRLIETLRLEAGGYCRLELHLQRLEASAAAFRFPFDRDRVLTALAAPVSPVAPVTLAGPAAQRAAPLLRVRLTLDEWGHIEVHSDPLQPTTTWRYAIAGQALDSRDTLLRHKTDWREFHDAQRQLAARDRSCDEVLLCNERGELCEGSRSNLFLAHGDKLLTPVASSGLLPGCLRQELLATGRCREAVLTLADLDAADQVYFGNSLRGLVPAALANGTWAKTKQVRSPPRCT
jgi:para-aminobenzoate synthetase/4-amino-4-deoxychorismate lyase